MITLVVFLQLLLFSAHSTALFFPQGSHNRGPPRLATAGTITLDPPTRLIRRQTPAASTLQPVVAVTNTTNWASQTNQLCQANVNTSTISNPAGVYPCYNVLSFNPNNGNFVAEVRMMQIVNMENQTSMASVTGSSILFEFPDATVTNMGGTDDLAGAMGTVGKLVRRQSTQQINIVSSFLLNGTAEISHNTAVKTMLTPTTAMLTLNMSSGAVPFGLTDSMVAFANGVFSNNFVAPTTANATAAAVTSTGLVIPGITFGIVPIGFYLYSSYWAVFTALILWGAWNKRKYRDAFRRRRAAVLNFTTGKRV